jgi:SAM-dependent methyltransferase
VTLTPALVDFLVSDVAQAPLQALAADDLSDGRSLALLTRLRRTFSAEQAGALLELARLRLKAVDKFGADAARLYFTRDALEQASDPLIRAYRARTAPESVLDAGCGIGADSLAFAASGSRVLGLDLDDVRVRLAALNAEVLGLSDRARFAVADVREPLPDGYALRFFDPARRDASGRRLHDVSRYQPPLDVIRGWETPVLVKLSPGVELAQLTPYGGAVEFISVGGDLKEALLHLPGTSGTFATLLTSDGEVQHWQRESLPDPRPLSPPREWLLEPDAALLRAGLVEDAAAALGANQLDATIAYLTADARPESAWVRAWRVRDWLPFNVKRLRASLRKRDIGTVTIKKRGSPLTPEQLAAQLKLQGRESCTLVLTRHDGAPIVLICDDYVP